MSGQKIIVGLKEALAHAKGERLPSISTESVLSFLAREKRVSTEAIGYRFGRSTRDMKRELDSLRRRGLVTAEREVFDIGAMNAWTLTDMGQRWVDGGKG